jgi:subtilisin family serine protease
MRKNSIFLNSFRAASVLLATAIVLSSVPAAAAPMGFSGNHTNRGNSANAPGNSGSAAASKKPATPSVADLLVPAPNRPDGRPAPTSGAVLSSDDKSPASANPGSAPGSRAPASPAGAILSKVRSVDIKAERAANAKAARGERGKPALVSGRVPKPGNTARFIVTLNENADLAAVATLLSELGIESNLEFSGALSALTSRLTSEQITTLANDPNVAFLERDFQIRLVDPVRDIRIQSQAGAPWGLDRIDSPNLPLDSVYNYNRTGSNVKAYVVDTGVRTTHVDFGGRVSSGFSSISDGNGVNDCNGHGTHVAGTIAGQTFGVAKSATIVPVRVLSCEGSGTLSGVIAGLDWIGANHIPGTPAVVNLSLGGAASSTLDAAVSGLIEKGISVVVAAGNSSADACTFSPARVPAAITVAASTSSDSFASWSNFGNCVDVIAPGAGIVSSWASSDTASAISSGTSMAAPHVAGAIALMLEDGFIEPGVVAANLSATASKDKITNIGPGTLNALVFTDPLGSVPESEVSVPGVVGFLTFTASPRRTATASWTLPDDGGSPLTLVTVELFNGSGNRVATSYLSGASTSLGYRNLKQGTRYFVVVRVSNQVGTGEPATSNQVTAIR